MPARSRYAGRHHRLSRPRSRQQSRQERADEHRLEARGRRDSRVGTSSASSYPPLVLTAPAYDVASPSRAQGFTWGSSPSPLFSAIRSSEAEGAEEERKFDLILLSDLVFNHSQHSALLDSCLSLLAPSSPSSSSPAPPAPTTLPTADLTSPEHPIATPAVLCFFSHHRPTEALIEADLGILSLAESKGWTVRRVWRDEEAGVSCFLPHSLCLNSGSSGAAGGVVGMQDHGRRGGSKKLISLHSHP